MLPQQRNEATIEDAIKRVRKVLDAAENSNQAGEDLIVVMASGDALYGALKSLTDAYCALLLMKAEDPSRFDGPGTPYGHAKSVLSKAEGV